MVRGLVIGFGVVLSACSVPISAGLDEADASQAVVALEKSGIAAEKDKDPDRESAYRVLVSRDDAASALGVLAQGSPAAGCAGRSRRARKGLDGSEPLVRAGEARRRDER